jgi:uncharacterized protein (DUF2141 family)
MLGQIQSIPHSTIAAGAASTLLPQTHSPENPMKLTLTHCTLASTLLAATLFTSRPALAQQTPVITPTCTLIVHVDGFRNQKGDAGLSIFNSPDGWPENNDKSFLHGGHPFSGTATTITLQVPAGRYAIVALHDENSNHKLDRRFGIPKEGFGFSNNPKVYFTAPSFDTAAMPVTCPTTETTIHLIYK